MSTPMLKEPRASQPIARSRKCRKRITLIAGAECNKKQKFREIVYDRALIMNRCGTRQHQDNPNGHIFLWPGASGFRISGGDQGRGGTRVCVLF